MQYLGQSRAGSTSRSTTLRGDTGPIPSFVKAGTKRVLPGPWQGSTPLSSAPVSSSASPGARRLEVYADEAVELANKDGMLRSMHS